MTVNVDRMRKHNNPRQMQQPTPTARAEPMRAIRDAAGRVVRWVPDR